MNVALDAAPLTLTSGGLSRYAYELSRALASEFPEDRYVLLSDQPFTGPENVPKGDGPRSWLEKRWWTYGLPRTLAHRRIDLFHGTNFEVPYVPTRPAVLTVHDLSPWRDPAWHVEAVRVRRRVPWLIGLGLATMIVTPTKAIRREAIEYFRVSGNRVVAVPEAASECFRPVATDPAPPYFLFAGTLEPRKNVGVLLDAWRTVAARHSVDLVLAGRVRSDGPQIPDEPGLRLVGEISDAELARLYSGAVAVLYPSLYEGFGLPVIEAMQCGAAVLTSHDPALEEVSGGAALHLDARDARAWAAAMTAILESPGQLAGLRAGSLARAREFSWQQTARLTREVYAEAIRRFGA